MPIGYVLVTDLVEVEPVDVWTVFLSYRPAPDPVHGADGSSAGPAAGASLPPAGPSSGHDADGAAPPLGDAPPEDAGEAADADGNHAEVPVAADQIPSDGEESLDSRSEDDLFAGAAALGFIPEGSDDEEGDHEREHDGGNEARVQ